MNLIYNESTHTTYLALKNKIDTNLEAQEGRFPAPIDRRLRANIAITSIDLYELTTYLNSLNNDENRIISSYQIILKREPDVQGLKTYTNYLRANNLTLLLGKLRYSREGRKVRIRVCGLLNLYLQARVKQIFRRIKYLYSVSE